MTAPLGLATLPLAQYAVRPGLPQRYYKRYNRVRKAQAIANILYVDSDGTLTRTGIANLTSTQMNTAARAAGVEIPRSDETRDLVRSFLRLYIGAPVASTNSDEGPATDEADDALGVLALLLFRALLQGASK